jgi:hypothetical protein
LARLTIAKVAHCPMGAVSEQSGALLYPPLIACFKRANPPRHLHQFVCHGVAGRHSGSRARLLHQQFLAVLQCRYTPFELLKLSLCGRQALHKFCDVLEKVFDAAGELPGAA